MNYMDLIIGCVLFIIIVVVIGYLAGDMGNKSISGFANVVRPPYITQSLQINIYATDEDFPKYAYLMKAALLNSIMVRGRNGIKVLVPRTTTSIPIQVYANASSTRFSIIANGIEQPIRECDFIATIY
jgi:hypothetical protein